MKRRTAILAGASLIALATACASARNPSRPSGEPALVSPAELVASLADVANGRNADMADTGLVLKTIELKLLVARENRAGGRVSFLVLDAEASRRSEVSFTQSFTLELPPPPARPRSVSPTPAVPGVVEFVEAALAAARELAAAAEREGLPQKLREVELSARIVRSARIGRDRVHRDRGAGALGGRRPGGRRNEHRAARLRQAVRTNEKAVPKDRFPNRRWRYPVSASPPEWRPSLSSKRGT